MARKYTGVNASIWSDPDFIKLSAGEQHMYLMLWTYPGSTQAGTLDWAPKKFAARTSGLTPEDVHERCAGLMEKKFIIIDPATDELLVRSFIRWTRQMASPRMAISVVNTANELASPILRGVIVSELMKIKNLEPRNKCWKDDRVRELMDIPAVTPEDAVTHAVTLGFTLSVTHPVTHPVTVTERVSVTPSVTPSVRVNAIRKLENNKRPTSEPDDTPTSLPDDRKDVQAVLDLLVDGLTANDVKHNVTKKWHDQIRLMLDKDERPLEEAKAVTKFAVTDEFWKSNILSASKLREKYDQLRLQMGRKRPALKIVGDDDPFSMKRLQPWMS